MTIKKAITIGLLGATIIGLIAVGIKFNIFNDKNTKTYETKAEEQLTDLTNTKWYLNTILDDKNPVGQSMLDNSAGLSQWQIYFTSNSTEYTSLGFSRSYNTQQEILTSSVLMYNYTQIYNYKTQTYIKDWKYIEITGGAKVTDTRLIDWFNQNATQITTNNVANTTWQINEEITTEPNIIASINFYSNGVAFDTLYIGYNDLVETGNYIRYKNNNINALIYNNQWSYYWKYSKIIITNGTDTNNTNLIIWLFTNAKQIKNINTLQNTKWKFLDNPSVNIFTMNFTYDIIFTTNKETCNGIKIGYITDSYKIAYSIKTDGQSPYAYYQVYTPNTWASNNYKTIIITSGNDIQSKSLISYLITNATGVAYQPIPTNPDDYDIENGNFASLQSVMLQILTMPFTFISQAFNVTLWPNTAWEFNISNFIMAIIAIASILFIIKLFTSGFSIIGNYSTNVQNNKLTKQKTIESKARTNLINRTDPNKKTIKKE